MDKWMQGNRWYIRDASGKAVLLNSEDGANYVLGLQERLAVLEDKIAQAAARKKPGPKETK